MRFREKEEFVRGWLDGFCKEVNFNGFSSVWSSQLPMAVLPSFLLLSFLAAAAAAPNRPFITQYPLQQMPPGLQVKRVLLDTELVKRSGLMDNILERLSPKAGSRNSPPKMSQIHRLPQPPKYPLYDMPSIGMATPPPAPLLSPMSLMPSEYYGGMGGAMSGNYGGHQQGGGNNYGAASNHYESTIPSGRDIPKRRGGPAAFRANRRNHQGGPPPQQQRQPQQNGGRRRTRPPGRGKKGPPGPPKGFDHPMASNINAVSSPPLGRPLGYEEYMKRPNHAYTQDPWNFDPMRTQNTMPHTDGLKYNYDPLGMNALESSQGSHLDPQKMSYPGDYFTNQFESPGEQAQWGGWDKQGQSPSQTPITYDKYSSSTNNNYDKSLSRYDTIGQYSQTNSRDEYGDLFNAQDAYSPQNEKSGNRKNYQNDRNSFSSGSRREQQSVEPYPSSNSNDFRSALDSYLNDGAGGSSDVVHAIETLGPAVEDRVSPPEPQSAYSTIPSNYDESYFSYSARERERDRGGDRERDRDAMDADRPLSDPISDASTSYSSHYGSPTSYELPTQEPKGHGNPPLSDTYNPYDDQENFASRYARKSSYYGAPKKGERKENSNSYVILKPEDLVLERIGGGGDDEGMSILKEFMHKDSEVARSLLMAIS